MACLETPEPAEQGALPGVYFPGTLCDGGLRLGVAIPGARRCGAVPRPILGVGLVRYWGNLRDGRVQDEPPAQREGTWTPLHTPLHRRASHRDPRPEHVLVLRALLPALGPRVGNSGVLRLCWR